MKRVFTKQEAIDALRKQHSIPQEETIDIEGSLCGTYTPFYTTASTPMCTGTILN